MLTILIISALRKLIGPNADKYLPIPSDNAIRVLIILFTFLTITFAKAFSQTSVVQFEIYKDSRQIGVITSHKKTVDNKTNITTDTKVKVNLLFTVHFNERRSVMYNQNVLESAKLTRDISSMMEKTMTTTRSNNKYLISSKQGNNDIRGDIKICVSDLYFEEPRGITKVYSEYWQQYIAVNKLSDHVYATSYPDGSSTIFNYSAGQCTGMTTKTKYGTITINRVSSSLASNKN